MADATIPVDLLNPGQVFACMGLMEAAAVLFGDGDRPADVVGGYEWAIDATAARFMIQVPGEDCPIEAVVEFLARAQVSASAPARMKTNDPKGVATATPITDEFPFQPPEKPASLPVQLSGIRQSGQAITLPIEHWGEKFASSGRDHIKFWGGNTSGALVASQIVRSIAEMPAAFMSKVATRPFSVEARMSSSFRFDWRRDYVALDAGFSPNNQSRMSMIGYPLVEVLAALGLQNARPQRIDQLTYRYAVSAEPLPLSFARAVMGTQSLAFPSRTFRMRLGWPGKEGQSRCIVDTQEETT